MKKFAPYLLILLVGFLALALMTSNALAQKCQHLHQLSKKLQKQQITMLNCKLCVCEKMESYIIKHRIRASVLADCDCDETNDRECDKFHQHPNSGDGDNEGWACVWSGSDDPTGPIIPPEDANYQSSGIPDDCIFDATITRVVKYCKDTADHPGSGFPRSGYHSGTWKLICGTERVASGSLHGVDGVNPCADKRSTGSIDRSDHQFLPCGQTAGCAANEDPCDGAACYIAGYQVGCILGSTTDLFFRFQCPPTGTYDKEEVGNIADCELGDLYVINDFRGKQICITPTEDWKIKACYGGGNYIDCTTNPCDQWATDWCVSLEGVIAINATDCIQ
ncbi:MAG TPA: hypothetical protein ACFYD6_10540 [Candidatus Brocadiia bacterium]|nr:hypothetical protein [Candidatus Brocadiales bacterium]